MRFQAFVAKARLLLSITHLADAFNECNSRSSAADCGAVKYMIYAPVYDIKNIKPTTCFVVFYASSEWYPTKQDKWYAEPKTRGLFMARKQRKRVVCHCLQYKA